MNQQLFYAIPKSQIHHYVTKSSTYYIQSNSYAAGMRKLYSSTLP